MSNRRSLSIAVLLVLALVIVACAPRMGGLGGAEPTAVPQPSYAGDKGGVAIPPADTSGGAVSPTGSEERMIVRVAELSLVVRDTEEAVAEIKGIVGGLGGYIVDIQLWRDSDQLRGTVMVRVPAESLEDALTEFKSLAVKVQRETGSSRDVTEEYSDLEAQLRNLEATEKELRELLATVRERTGKAEDILAVYRELTSIRGQIEQLTGRMQYLERTAAMSAVSIELIPDVLARPIASTGWRPSETASAAVRALVNTLRVLAGAAIWVALYVLPIAALVAIPLVALWLLWRRRRRGRLPVSDQSQ